MLEMLPSTVVCRRRWTLVVRVGIASAMSTLSAAGGDLPVVFVPGLGGTELVQERPGMQDRRVWVVPSLITEGAIDRMRLTDEGKDQPGFRLKPGDPLRKLQLRVTFELSITDPDYDHPEDQFGTRGLVSIKKFPIPVYGDFLDWAAQAWPGPGRFGVAGYDWRKGAGEESDLALGAAIDRALAGSHESQVVLVAHSLGGLVARHYLKKPENAKRVRSLIAAGTAWWGAPKPARALRYGYCFGLGGRVDPKDEDMVRGIYLYYLDDDQRLRKARSLSLVSLVDLDESKRLARTLPCVFQLLPSDAYMEAYGKALGRQKTSVFLGEDAATTTDSFRALNPRLFDDAASLRQSLLEGGSLGVRHVLIAGTLDPSIQPDSAMDMRMADLVADMKASGGKAPRLRWIGVDLAPELQAGPPAVRPGKPTFFEAAKARAEGFVDGVKSLPNRFRFLAPNEKALKSFGEAFKAAGYRPNKKMADAFFDIIPTFRDFGNYNWQSLREWSFKELRKKSLPLFVDPYVAVDTDAEPLEEALHEPSRWGDGATPLVSATLGLYSRVESRKSFEASHPNSPFGPGTVVHVVPLGKLGGEGSHTNGPPVYLEHSRMLDDKLIREKILGAYRDACSTPAAPSAPGSGPRRVAPID